MNKVVEVRMASWKAMVQERNASGLSIEEWRAANNVSESQYYYRLRQLRNRALAAAGQTSTEHTGGFMRVPFCPTDPSSGVALRIRRADTVIEVSGDAPDNILAFLKAVMTDVV